MKKELYNLNRALGSLIVEPLRAMVMGAPSEDAHNLSQCYDQLDKKLNYRAEVARCQARSREVLSNLKNTMVLQATKAKMQELKANMAILGKEITVAIEVVESQ
eukprot:Gb_02224 [translate_table: standard]